LRKSRLKSARRSAFILMVSRLTARTYPRRRASLNMWWTHDGCLDVRWFLAAPIILVLFALDRAYMDGQNAALIMSLAQRTAATINEWANDLVRFVRR
jgi:hypothetical protein